MIGLLALTGIVILVSALASGPFERRGISLVLLFLLVGLLAGPYGLGVAVYDLSSPRLQLVAVVSLTMVLFSDAVSLRIDEIRRHAGLAVLILGPGTLATAAIIAVAAWQLLGVSGMGAAMLGAALASTDPVLLRAVLRNPRVPDAVRLGLRLESGLNDAVLLPIILIAMAIMTTGESSAGFVAGVVAELVIVAPLIGAAIGFTAIYALDMVRARYGMRRDYESLYTLGIALTAFAAAESLHTSGYIAAFAAGLAIVFRDVELCDCFHDYGEATAEAALLLTFVALGGSLIWMGVERFDLTHALFVLIALATRPLVLLLVARHRSLERRDLYMLAWFGPRGLSSLLLILVPVFAGVPGSEDLFVLCSMVVLASVVLHGASPALLQRGNEDTSTQLRMTVDELQQIRELQRAHYVLDVRTEESFATDPRIPEGVIRVNPKYVVAEVKRMGLPKDAYLALYCT